MRKIANTTELTSELERILDYAGSYQPSRVRLAAELGELSVRVAGVVHRTASSLGSHFRKSLKEIKAGRGISAAQTLAQLDDDV